MDKYSFSDWLNMGMLIIGYLYIIVMAVEWFSLLLAKHFDRFRNRKDPRQRAINDFYDAFDLGSIKPGGRLTVKTENGLCLRITRVKIDG